MYHLLANFVSLANVADTDVPALSDDIIPIQNNHFILPTDYKLFAAAIMAVTLLRGKIVTPSLRQVASPYIRPPITALTPPTDPNFWNLVQNPLTLRAFEETAVQATDSAAGPNNCVSLMWIGDGITPAPQGNVYSLRSTSTVAAVANTWTSIALTWQDAIPSGVYAMISSEHNSATAKAHRWIFSNQVPRPGNFSFANGAGRLPYPMQTGLLGLMGTFRSNDLPRFQVLCDAADASHEVYAWCVRVGNL